MGQTPFDEGYFRRQFPRRALQRKIGFLVRGEYHLGHCEEIGEGGISLVSDLWIDEGSAVVVSLQIPGGSFVSLQAMIKSRRKNPVGEKSTAIYGLSFTQIPFANKREIRVFVSARKI